MSRLAILFPNPYRYSETFIKNHVEGLRPTATLTGGWKPYIDENGKSIFKKVPLKYNYVRALVKRLIPSLYGRLYHSALKDHLSKLQLDHVLIEYGVTAVSIYRALVELKVPFSVHFHGFDAYEYNYIDLYKDEYKRIFTTTSHIIAVSKDMKKQLIELGAPESKIFIIPCGIPTDKFVSEKTNRRSPYSIVSVGRFTAKKSPENLIRAFKIIHEAVPESRLKMIGDGELWESSKILAKELGIDQKITFLGVLSQDNIVEILKSSSLFLQHSQKSNHTGDSEGTPGTILEASSCELPIVSTLHAGIKEAVIHGKTGYLVPEGDYKKMAEYAIELLRAPEKSVLFGKNGRSHIIENYDLKLQIQKLHKLIRTS